ncbi:MAG: peptidylprolyl isomerase [Planctomycetes bacterium]|nr:peptidylprolyl isomerase [Planctomycetota bacterium]
MRSLLIIIGILLVVCAADVFGMGKSDGSKEKVEQPLEKEAAEVAKPAKVEPVPVKVEPVKKPVETLAKIEPAKPAEKPDENKVVLTINGIPVKSGEVESRVDNTMKMQMSGARSRMPANLPPDTLKNMRERMRQGIVEGLIIEKLIDQKVKERKIEVTDKEVEDVLQNILTNNKMTMEQFKEQLSTMGLTLEVLRGQFKRRVGLVKLLELEMKAAGEPFEATDAEAKTYYDANQKRFGESVRASHILIKADMKDETAKAEATKKIEDLLKRARAGEDFAELAKQYTDDPGSKKTGGEYTFPRGQMVPPFEQAAFSLEVGQISDVVETQYGYHIIKLSEKIPAKSFDDVKADILKNLGEQKKNAFWSTKLRQKYRSEAKLEWAPGEKERIDKVSRPPAIRPSPK